MIFAISIPDKQILLIEVNKIRTSFMYFNIEKIKTFYKFKLAGIINKGT
jgi:hypothetical protein